jgi:hypothetical protein
LPLKFYLYLIIDFDLNGNKAGCALRIHIVCFLNVITLLTQLNPFKEKNIKFVIIFLETTNNLHS